MNRPRDSQGRFVKKELVGSPKTQKPQKGPLNIVPNPKEIILRPPSQLDSLAIPLEIFQKFTGSYKDRCSKSLEPLENPFKAYYTP